MKLSKDHYTADACIVWCFDNRFWPAFEEFLKSKQVRHFDPVMVAGGSLHIPTNFPTGDWALARAGKQKTTTRIRTPNGDFGMSRFIIAPLHNTVSLRVNAISTRENIHREARA